MLCTLLFSLFIIIIIFSFSFYQIALKGFLFICFCKESVPCPSFPILPFQGNAFHLLADYFYIYFFVSKLIALMSVLGITLLHMIRFS